MLTQTANSQQLDRNSVKWLEQYLIAHDRVTCLIVSHDSGYVLISSHPQSFSSLSIPSFLDNVTTDILHYETKKVCFVIAPFDAV